MITSERTRNQRGLGAVSLALTLPIVLLIVIGSIELFLYMRAVSLVTRAAGEAAQVMASASPSANYTANSFTGVGDKEEIKTPSGGVIGKDLDASVASHGKFYGPLPEATALPFELARSLNPDNSGSAEAGVMYLPLATAYTCLKPLNEEDDYSNSNCGDGTNLQSRLGFLTYQQPTKADFDGDGKEDLAYFSPNPTGPDWWIIPSSSGTLFRNALTFELGPDSGAGVEGVEMVAPQAEHWMPCVADYDNDGKSDVCVASSNGSEITIKIRFSSNLFYLNSAFTVSAHGAAKILPVPGRWHSATVDQFAVILVEAGTRKYQLSTLVWPAFEAKLESPALNSDAFSLVDGPKEYTDDSYKPTASKNWRPTFGDHNGDGLLDISWAEWPGGYLTNLIAGKALGMESSNGVPAPTALLAPWGLKISPSGLLWVIERNTHRVSQVGWPLTGKASSPSTYTRIAGLSSFKAGISPDLTFLEPDPLAKGLFDTSPVPVDQATNGCATCYTGGMFSGDGASAQNAALHSPTDVADWGVPGRPAFVADFGNYRIRRISPVNNSSYVKGGAAEIITTIAGGVATVDCKTLYGAGPSIGEPAVDWISYSLEARTAGIHPTCVNLRALSLELLRTKSNPRLFVGDSRGAIFMIKPGADNEFNANQDSTETMIRLVGSYNEWTSLAQTDGLLIALPTAMAMDSSNNSLLRILVRTSQLPDALTKGGAKTTGGIIMLDAGTDESFGTADDKLTVEFGSWNDSSLRPADWPSVAADTVTLRNPTALAVLIPNPKVEPKREFLITGWWNNSGSEPYENSLVRNQNRLAGNTTYASTAWLNNSHSNSRGMRALDGTSVPFNLSWESALPLKTLPVAPGAGIAASADGKRIFFSDTRRGQIYTTFLDYDGDGIADVEDNDIDGDLLTNAVEGKLNQYSPKSISPVASQAPDPLMWANTSISVPSPGNRIEWWIDRVNAVTSIDSSLEVPILPEEDGLFTLFNNETVVIANGRGAMHSTPVWPGGPDRDTELNGTTGLPLLSPIVMGSRTPDKNTIKDVSGYDHCNWDTFGADYDSASLNAQGVPSTTCRTESVNLPKTRRAHLALWANYVLPFASLDLTSDGKNDQLFIDWDGDGVRNPVLINNQRVSAVSRRPLMAYIGNLPDSVCPGSFAIAELATLRPALSDSSSPISPNEDNEPQYRCAQTIPFYTTSASQVASVMLDHHLEWTTSSTKSTISYPSVIGDRLSLGTSGDGDPTGTIGPVAETAYQILERSLPVTKRESLSAPQSAMVEISTAAGEYGLAEITVSYRWGFGPMMSIFFGEEATTISAKAQRRVYNFNRSS